MTENKTTIPWATEQILKAVKGDVLNKGPEDMFSKIAIDSRTISPGEVFVAIKGERFDGHTFIEDVIARGIRCVILDKDRKESLKDMFVKNQDVTFIGVGNTILALGGLASFLRTESKIKVAAITGSNGKTTTKEMTSAILNTRYHTLSTQGNFNNHIGLPLTLFNLEKKHQWAVLEMGMNHFGEIARLTEICSPDIGIVTNVGEAHLEGLGSIEGVAKAKGELPANMGSRGTVILNADDKHVWGMAEKTSAQVLSFGFSEKADIRATALHETDRGTRFSLVIPSGEETTIQLTVPGKFMVGNALAAAGTGFIAGLTLSDIKAGLEGFSPAPGRMSILSTEKGFFIIDDTYNANPNSMASAIDTLRSLKKNNRGVGVLGDMFELGNHASMLHEKIGLLSAKSGMAKLFITGQYAETIKNGALSGGMKDNDIVTGTKTEIIEKLTTTVSGTDWILVKGSRAMGMEHIVGDLKKWGDL
ncbi:MAG: UDP-N-acetylmuramoyl-tripeptide--D-alanyl-D-alanine ligase [Proteobacteria bacterium]|nr:UDP-N-acetylmuramoyl-tripeptide--D-alanyl-D-alanine ligase [Pseudomonadota bacterium]